MSSAFQIAMKDMGNLIELANANQKTIVPVVNVKGYGAKGDGIADDTTALQALITSTPDGGIIGFPKGRYRITSPLTWSEKELHLVAFGEAVIVESVAVTVPLIQLTNASNSSITGLTCEGAETLAGFSGTSDKIYAFIKVVNSSYVNLTQLFVKNKTYGVYLDTCYKCTVDGLDAEGFLVTGSLAENGANYSSAVNVQGGENNLVLNLTAKNIGAGVLIGMDGKYHIVSNAYLDNVRDNGVYISSGESCNISHIHVTSAVNNSGVKARGSKHTITECNVKNAFVGYTLTGNGTTPDSLGYNGHGTICEGNTAESCSRMGLEIGAQDSYFPRDFKVLNNNFINCGEAGSTYAAIKISQGLGHQVRGNAIDGSASDFGILLNGISSDRCKKYIVSQNAIRGNGTTPKNGIRALYVDSTTFAENEFDNLLTDGLDCRFVDNSLMLGNIYYAGLVLNLSTSFQSNGNIVSNNIGNNIGMDFTKNVAHGNIPALKNYHTSIAATPYSIGQEALVSGVFYRAKGTSSAADWVALN